MQPETQVEPFPLDPSDPLADAHAVVSEWVEKSSRDTRNHEVWQDVPFPEHDSGKVIQAAKGDEAARLVHAAALQVAHWDRAARQVIAGATTDNLRMNPQHLPGWNRVWARRRRATQVITALMRRKLPLTDEALVAIVEWCNAAPELNPYFAPFGAIVKVLTLRFQSTPPSEEWVARLRLLAGKLRATNIVDCQRQATALEQLSVAPAAAVAEEVVEQATLPPPQPAPVGTPGVLRHLKALLRVPQPAEPDEVETELTGLDQYPLPANSPLRERHTLLSELIEQGIQVYQYYYGPQWNATAAGRSILKMDPDERGWLALAAAERRIFALTAPHPGDQYRLSQARYAASVVLPVLLELPLVLSREGLADLILVLGTLPRSLAAGLTLLSEQMVEQLEGLAADVPLSEGERFAAALLRGTLIPGPPLGAPPDLVVRLTRLIGDGASYLLVPGDAWAEAINTSVSALPPARQTQWLALLRHALTAKSARPSARWIKTARTLIGTLGEDVVQRSLEEWLPIVDQKSSRVRLADDVYGPRNPGDLMNDENANCLRGLIWLVPLLPPNSTLMRAVTTVALSAYRKVPGTGPREPKVGNAAVYALSELKSPDAVGQLAILKTRVRTGSAQKEIEKAFTKTAEALGLPRDQIEELGVPTYGLEAGGRLTETLGDYTAELVVTGSDAELLWSDAKGKRLKSVPARVKADHKEDLQDLRQTLKDVQAMLPAQRDRIDALFLQQANWSIDVWRERYLDHPLVGTIARRLLWCVDGTPALFVDGIPTDTAGQPIPHGRTAEITLWHPTGRPVDEVLAWRNRLEELGITQPFKQAHREVYLLTDAELRTNTYSNRFAAHVLRQHQFNALCAARGWKNRLRLMVDDDYEPAHRLLPQWGLRAEFWVEGLGGDYGTDTNEAGVFLRLTTDQVRFYRIDSAQNFAHAAGGGYTTHAHGPGDDDHNVPLPLDQIPPLVFSEIMRDVDLFVGVASIGNDPTWHDGGPQGRFLDYWQSYSFGDLNGSANTRKQVLERLIPRLRIAGRCSFSERFLVVKGDLRTYKIHLGSGNILMEPNDQYLCIVPDARTRAKGEDPYLPFEGDATLSIILSKALMLADDTKIKDATITLQLRM